MSWVVCVDISHMQEGMNSLVTLDASGHPKLFDTEEEAEEYCKLVWPETGYIKEYHREEDT